MKIKTVIIIVILILIFSGKLEKMRVAFSELNMCFDIGVCAEGITVGVGKESVKINKENCLKHNWKWNDEKKYCNTRTQD